MNKLIFEMISKRINNKNTKLIISSLTYYAILALIPTLLLTMLILKNLNLNIPYNYHNFLDKIMSDFFVDFFIVIVIFFMISRIYFFILKEKFSLSKSLVLSISFSLLSVSFLTLFITTYMINNFIVSNLIKASLLFCFFFILIYFSSISSLKYSLLVSLLFSLICNLFFYLFFYAATFFIGYENYYGFLAPVFLLILAIYLFIYISCIAYIGAEEFTKISKIKFVKR